MNILFLTLGHFKSIEEKGIYTDLLRYFKNKGHNLFVVNPIERRYKEKTTVINKNDIYILNVRTLNIQKTHFLEKGLATLLIENQFKKAIKKHIKQKIDLILYTTPPITFYKVVKYIKERDNAKAYLLLKDIFPQNAVDLGLLKEKSFIHSYFRKKEVNLYNISDYIGCMSPANVDYILRHNSGLREKTEVCPNSIEIPVNNSLPVDKKEIRQNYNIPQDATVFIYGGNLGKPQGLEFLLKILESNKNFKDRFFLIVGSGTEYKKIKTWFDTNNIENALLRESLPKNEYDKLVSISDVGLIFLDPRFTIPNYPSRLLSYMENKLPILVATDSNTDIGKIAQANQYGYWVVNGELNKFNKYLEEFVSNKELASQMGINGYEYMKNNYSVVQSYEIIMKHFN